MSIISCIQIDSDSAKMCTTMDQDHSPTTIYINAYRSFLRAEGEMNIDQVVRLYQNMKPSIHKFADQDKIDVEAFMYSYLRLPPHISQIQNIVMAQIGDIFIREGYKIEFWQEVHAPARRRKMYYDGEKQLAVFINSVTDLDDMVGLLTAYEIEWNKIHARLKNLKDISATNRKEIQKALEVDDENWDRLSRIWDKDMYERLQQVHDQEVHFGVRLLRGNYVDYKKAAQRWFENIIEHTRYKELRNKPLYFVSSNTHSIVNNLTGWVNGIEDELIGYLEANKSDRFLSYWKQIEKGEHPGSKENFLWYILKKYEREHPEIKEKREVYERELGIDFIDAKHYLDINAQVFSLKDVGETHLASKLGINADKLNDSEALVLNIDYPLGSGAYMVLSTILHNVNDIRGVYILGKASFLHANLGDIGLPTKVYDTYSDNTFIFNNSFTKEYFKEFKAGSVLTNQKVVSTKGTFLHPEEAIQQYFIEDYTIIEMEDGPYLNALYETTHFDRYPEDTTVTMLNAPIDIGIIHYASDTPFTKAITLGTRNLGYEGVEATYASSLAILKRIIEVEMKS